ncbi:MAG: PKD domain-containing protein [Chitinophagaceae bacterium]
MGKKTALLLLSCMLLVRLQAQLCTRPGQTPVSAILVCGSQAFPVTTPSFCGQSSIPVPCADGFPYTNKNPLFYRMSCFSAGTLGFLITPADLSANYDWQLFDITSTNPDDIFTNPSLFIACNWSGDLGETGASADGTSLTVCSGPQNLYSQMPDIIQGHTYLLMIVNQSGSNSSCELLFTGGTASITDAVDPHLQSARASCNSTEVVVRLNKKIQCYSIDPSGTDFILSSGATITAATPGVCDPVFGTDSVILSLSQSLLIGNYSITLATGSDGNTLIDACSRSIPAGEVVPFSIGILVPTPFDSITAPGCSPKYLDFIFSKPMRCSSVATDGSDFIITGPQAVTANFNPATCGASGKNFRIRLSLTTPLLTGGTYTVQLARGTDGNTIEDECGQETPAGGILSFTLNDPVSAIFTYNMPPSCNATTASFFHDGNGNATSWDWNFGNGDRSIEQNPVRIFNTPGPRPVQLIVSNGSCTDTTMQTLVIGGHLVADFSVTSIVCPLDTIHFDNKSSGGIDSWKWDFGNGNTSTIKTPVGFYYAELGRDALYTITLIAYNSVMNCGDTVRKVVKALSHCHINVPSAFTPNGDGLNDFLYPLNAVKADQLEFKVYNRYGQLVFFTRDWTRKWDGRIRGILQDTGIYAWMLRYTDRDRREKIFLKGTTLLLR